MEATAPSQQLRAQLSSRAASTPKEPMHRRSSATFRFVQKFKTPLLLLQLLKEKLEKTSASTTNAALGRAHWWIILTAVGLVRSAVTRAQQTWQRYVAGAALTRSCWCSQPSAFSECLNVTTELNENRRFGLRTFLPQISSPASQGAQACSANRIDTTSMHPAVVMTSHDSRVTQDLIEKE